MYFARCESMTTGYEFGQNFTSSHQRTFINQAFSSYRLENPDKKYDREVFVFFKSEMDLKKNPKQLILYLKLFGRESFSVFPQTVQSIGCIVHVVTGKLYVDGKNFRKDI